MIFKNGKVDFDLSKIKVSDLTDAEIEELKIYLKSIPIGRAVDFYSDVKDSQEVKSNPKVEKFLNSKDISNIKDAWEKENDLEEENEPDTTEVKTKRALGPATAGKDKGYNNRIPLKIKKEEQKINTSKMPVKEIFLNLTSTTTPQGNEKLMEPFMPKGWKKDTSGNYYYKIGDPSVMFTCHLDTADSGQPKDITHVIKGDFVETDGKTILGGDDKAGAAIMIYMIQKGKEGLYYFFYGEERGCQGSRALDRYLDGNKDDVLYKKINKVVSLDRRDYDSIITFQGERCCSDEFADELAKRLNEAGGFKYKKDPTGLVTDSHSVAEKFPECTNLSVGYDDQHSVREKQNVVFLQQLADACLKVDWETLPVKRDPTKVEHAYSNYNRRGKYYSSEWEGDNRWWESGGFGTGRAVATAMGPGQLPAGQKYVTDYLGNEIEVADAQWCEYDKQWCTKEEAIWVEYVGFYTTPDFDASKVKPKAAPDASGLVVMTPDDFKKGVDIYSNSGEEFGTITDVGEDEEHLVTITTRGNTKFIAPPHKILTYNFKKKSGGGAGGTKKLTEKDLKEGLEVFHPGFGKGKIVGIRPDKSIVKVIFEDPSKGEKDLRVDVADMKF